MSRLLAFLGGAAEGVSSEIEKAEKSAKEEAMLRVKKLSESYEETRKANRELTNELKAEKDWITTTYSNATPEQIAYLQGSPAALQALKKMKDPTKISLSDVISIASGNESNAVAAERITAMPEVANKVAAAVKQQGRTGFGGFIESIAEGAGETAERRFARAMGTDIETLQNTKRLERPTVAGTFDMAAIQPPKTLAEQTEAAQLNLVDALRSGDDTKIDAARSELNNFTKAKESMTPEQTKFANKVADIKNRYMFGTPEERKAAKPEYDKLLSDIKAEALAKKTGEGDGESKIPALGTLNTFTSAAVARAVAAKHGDLIKSKQLAIVEKADGSVGIDYIGDNETLRRQILETQANAARNALSLYTDAKGQPFNRDVASVLNSYTSVVPSVVRQDGGATPPAAPAATPTPAAAPTAQPAKVVSRATVQAQADKNKVPFEVAAEEARKQGYTIR
jgi:hypothetical protein